MTGAGRARPAPRKPALRDLAQELGSIRRLQVELGAASKPCGLSSKADPNEIAAIPEQKASFDDCSSVEAAFDGQSVLRDTRVRVACGHDFRQSVDTEEVDSLAATAMQDAQHWPLRRECQTPSPVSSRRQKATPALLTM